MRPTEDVRKLVKNVPLNTNVQRDDEILNDVLNTFEQSQNTKSAYTQPSLWRIIMKSKASKFAAAAFVVALIVGVCQIDATRTAFARTTKMVSTGLAGLKAIILEMKTREPESPPAVPPADSNEREAAFQGRSIMANVYTFSVEAKQRDLREFFEAENIEWAPTGDNSNTRYAKLDPDKTKSLIGLSTSAAGIKLTSSPGLMVREGEEGIIGITGSEKQDDVALALVATVPDNGESIDLSLSFLNGQSGFEIPSIRIDKDDVLLFRLVTTLPSPDEQNKQNGSDDQAYILVLVKVKILLQS